jgi:hypothetical protein
MLQTLSRFGSPVAGTGPATAALVGRIRAASREPGTLGAILTAPSWPTARERRRCEDYELAEYERPGEL